MMIRGKRLSARVNAAMSVGVAVATALVWTLAIAGPAAAEPAAFTASYNVTTTGRNGTPVCPDNELVCGRGTSAQFGSFSYNTFVPGPGDLDIATLNFADGTLVLDETFQFSTSPGNSQNDSPGRGDHDYGNPNTIYFDWTLDSVDSTGVFSGLSGGTGTDILHFAGVAGQGTITGTLTASP